MANTAINTISAYQQGSYPFPKDQIDPKDKDALWGKKWCEAMYACWITDRTGVPYSQLEEIHTLRRYGAGNQDVAKYQKILLDESEDDGELEGFLNIDWEVFSVMPKFKHIIRGIFEEQEHAVVATAIDPKSTASKNLAKIRKWFIGRYKPLIDMVDGMAGQKREPEWFPESVDELELFSLAGGFKQAKEMEIEEALEYSFYISDWKETKRKMLDDFGDINAAAVKDYTDQYTRKAKVRYVDPANLVIQYSRHWDHRNSEYAGEIFQETISNIRKVTEIPEDELRNLAQFYTGRNRNATLTSWATDDVRLAQGGWAYDNFLIDVMDAEWFSVNSKYNVVRKTASGEEMMYEETWGKVYNTEKKQSKIHNYKVVYRCKWIIGSDYTYDFGLQYDAPRPGKKEVELSYKFYKLPGRSIVSLSVPNLDQMQLTWYKLQNALAMSANAGIAVEFTSLQNMKLGGDKMEPLEVLSIRRDTGDLIYKMTTHAGRPNVPGGFRPIQELEGGIGRQLEEFMRLFELNLNFIRDLTGINQVADASNPDPNQSVGGAEMAVAATTNALKPIYSGYVRLKELVARSMAIRVQMLVKYDKKAYEGYIPIIGGGGTRVLSAGAEVIDADWSIMIQAKPTMQRKTTILQMATAAMQPDKDGFTGIEAQDFLMIERLLEQGNLKYAEMFLTYRSKKNKERQLQIQQENMDLDAKNAQETAKLKEEEARKTLEFESSIKQKEEVHKYDLEDRNADREHQREMERITLEKSFDTLQKEKEYQNSKADNLKTA